VRPIFPIFKSFTANLLFLFKPWWAAQIARRGAGPPPIHPKNLTAEALASAIGMALSPRTQEAAVRIGEMIRKEVGLALIEVVWGSY
jgi:UDP:flavonoid glycosyltransferase YjiC (YdhE family)